MTLFGLRELNIVARVPDLSCQSLQASIVSPSGGKKTPGNGSGRLPVLVRWNAGDMRETTSTPGSPARRPEIQTDTEIAIEPTVYRLLAGKWNDDFSALLGDRQL